MKRTASRSMRSYPGDANSSPSTSQRVVDPSFDATSRPKLLNGSRRSSGIENSVVIRLNPNQKELQDWEIGSTAGTASPFSKQVRKAGGNRFHRSVKSATSESVCTMSWKTAGSAEVKKVRSTSIGISKGESMPQRRQPLKNRSTLWRKAWLITSKQVRSRNINGASLVRATARLTLLEVPSQDT